MQCLEEFIIEASPAISLLDLPVAKLQLMQAGDVLADIWKREQAEPKLRQLNDETRRMVLNLPRPEWARAPGKLSSQRKPPAKMIERISYKVVRVIDGRYYSLWRPDVEYVIGQRMKQAAKPGHASGYFSWPTQEAGQEYLAGCSHLLSRGNVVTPALALIECEIGGRTIDYGNKLCSTYLMPVRVMEVRSLIETQ